MPVRCELRKLERITVITVTGVLQSGEMIAAFNEVTGLSGFEPTFGSLVDLSNADLSGMSPDNLKKDAADAADVRGDAPHKRGVVLGIKDINGGVGRLIDAYFQFRGLKQVTRIFADRDECISWLKAPWTDDEKRLIE